MTFDAFPWTDLFLRLLTAFLGSLFAFSFALWLNRRERRAQRTSDLIKEYSSREMLVSRFVTVSVADRITDGEISIRDLALTMVQDCPVGFTGQAVDGLTEHAQISLLIGWMRRLAISVDHGWIDNQTLAVTLGGSLQWTLPFLLRVGEAAELVMQEYPSSRAPEVRASWIFALRKIDAFLRQSRLPQTLLRSFWDRLSY